MPIRDNVAMFEADLAAFGKSVEMDFTRVLKAVIFEFMRMVIVRTPVDTGRAAGSWMVGNHVDSFVLPESAELSRDAAVSQIMSKISAVNFDPPETVYWLYNNLPYIAGLEFGYYPNPPKKGSYVKGQGYVIKTVGGFSKQAPAGMVRISVADMELKIATLSSGRK